MLHPPHDDVPVATRVSRHLLQHLPELLGGKHIRERGFDV